MVSSVSRPQTDASHDSHFLRLFFALWPPLGCARALAQRQQLITGKKAHLHDLHLTLVFLGNQPQALLPVFDHIGQHACPPPNTLVFDRFGSFGGNKVLWAGMQTPPQALFDLQQNLVAALQRHGVVWHFENRFVPHITLARKASLPASGLQFETVKCEGWQLVLAQSRRHGTPFGGTQPRYQIIRRYSHDTIA